MTFTLPTDVLELALIPTPALLKHLNELREANGKKPLASWKASRDDLLLRITQEAPAPTQPAPQPSPDPVVIAEAVAGTPGKPIPEVTHVPASTPELTQPVKRRAAINTLVTKAIDTDTPTTVVDVKAAGKLPKLKTSKKEFNDMLEAGNKKPQKDTTESAARTKKTEKKIFGIDKPQGKGEFALYLESINMEGRVARAKLRRAKISPVDGRYPLTDAVKAALASDGRKKA